MTSCANWRRLLQRRRRVWSRSPLSVCGLSWTKTLLLRGSCELFGNYLIQVLQPWTISKPRLPPHVCQCATGAGSIGSQEGDLSAGHKRHQRLDEGRTANRRLDGGVDQGDRVVTCTIVRGEILFGISRLPRVDDAPS